jgi:hypothetical protein
MTAFFILAPSSSKIEFGDTSLPVPEVVGMQIK